MIDKPLRRDAERNRGRILDAARALVAEHGLDVSHDDIARAAGVGVGTVYRRFPDKHELFDELLAERVAELVTVAERAATGPTRGWGCASSSPATWSARRSTPGCAS